MDYMICVHQKQYATFKNWRTNNLIYYAQLYDKVQARAKSFAKVPQEFAFSNSHYLAYLQANEHMKHLTRDLEKAFRKTAIDKIIASLHRATRDIYPCLQIIFAAPRSRLVGTK